VAGGHVAWGKRTSMRLLGAVLARTARYERAGRLVRRLLRRVPRLIGNRSVNAWSRGRELPVAPAESFREWYGRERGVR